jgi:hypothetical protein
MKKLYSTIMMLALMVAALSFTTHIEVLTLRDQKA